MSDKITVIAEFDDLDILNQFTSDKYSILSSNTKKVIEYKHESTIYQIRWSPSYDMMTKNATCVECGLVANHVHLGYALDGSPFKPHFRIFHKDQNSQLTLMTRDHIIPASVGGPDKLWNFQTMCSTCNNKKSNTIVSDVFTTISLNELNEIGRRARRKLNNIFMDPRQLKSLHNLLLLSYITDTEFRNNVQNYDLIYNKFLTANDIKPNKIASKPFYKKCVTASLQMVNILRYLSL